MYAYSYANVIVSLNGYRLAGFAAGDDVITVAPAADTATTTVGADGGMVASISMNQAATVTLTFQWGSQSNYILSQMLNNQLASGARFAPLSMSIKDALSGDSVILIGGIITQQPTFQRGAVASDVEWQLAFETYVMTFGQAIPLSAMTAFTTGNRITV